MVKEIKERVLLVFRKHYSDKSKEFKRGFICCNVLYNIAFEKHFSKIIEIENKVNLHQRIKTLEKELSKKNNIIKKLEKDSKESKEIINDIKRRVRKAIYSLAKHYSYRLISSRKDEMKIIEQHLNIKNK